MNKHKALKACIIHCWPRACTGLFFWVPCTTKTPSALATQRLIQADVVRLKKSIMSKSDQIVKPILILIGCLLLQNCESSSTKEIENDTYPAQQVLSRIAGEKNVEKFEFKIDKNLHQSYSVKVDNNKVHVAASSQVALCRGAYDYLKNACNSIVSWSGNNINIPAELPEYSKTIQSPYKYHYYFNVVTHGYTTVYWDWSRWEKEIDWMAVHGINMPLIPGAHEAVLSRVFKKIGLSDKEIHEFFTGPAYLPFNRMGCIVGWDGPPPASFYDKQIRLTHQILDRMRELSMLPIIPAFAGFVPSAIQDHFPQEELRQMSWGGFDMKYQASILEPGSELFIKIGKMYISEWEKEFGKTGFYLADSFNEMDVPLSKDSLIALEELSVYGESVYRSIKESNPDAIWVMQGWTFPYHKKDGKIFWTPERLQALISRVPDDKLLILDLANEYNRLWWDIAPSWKTYDGFYNKQWIYSFIPNMGGKTALNGRLDLYAKMPFEALNYSAKGNLVGFGFAPEGIENNEIIYELLADVGWANEEFSLDDWIASYCKSRYGVFPEKMREAFSLFINSCFGSFTDHPRNTYQFGPDTKYRGTVHKSDSFTKGVELFLACSNECTESELYMIDAIEITTQYLGLKADELLLEFQDTGEKNYSLLNEALTIMAHIDKLLESHPNWNLQRWINFARSWGDSSEEKDYYEANARRIITTWGGWVNEYAAKTWSGLIREYYIPRWRLYYASKEKGVQFDKLEWEERWITSPGISTTDAFENPVEKVMELFTQLNNKH